MKNKLLIGIGIIAIIGMIFFSLQGNEATYVEQILKEREEKEHFMLTSPSSPFAENPDTFKGLNYFPPNPDFKVKARIIPSSDKNIVRLGTNDGKQKPYKKYGYAEFQLGDQLNKLLILELIERGPLKGTLFLAFGDETSANETYGAGRYLDIKKSKSGLLDLDFNLAYNPYCAYSESFSCPFPPAENLLNISIEAGEKTY
ncbi:MAG: DUF1684 domain-containing protein [Bacteroidota bacterium]